MKLTTLMKLPISLTCGALLLFTACLASAASPPLSRQEALAVINRQLEYPHKVAYGFGWKAGDAEMARSAVASLRQRGYIPLQDDEQMGDHKVLPTAAGSEFVDYVEFKGGGGSSQPNVVSVYVYQARVARIEQIIPDRKSATVKVRYFVEVAPFEPMYSEFCTSFCKRYLRNLGVYSHADTATLRKTDQGWQVIE
jgi:hypothetical protein